MRWRATASGHTYNIQRSGLGDTILLLHGFTGDHSTWRRLTDDLHDEYQVIATDILGHGASDAPADRASYHMEAVAADMADLLKQLACAPSHLLGYSMGGRLALYLALHYPALIESLTLESASPGLAEAAARAKRRSQDEALAQRIEAEGIGWLAAHWEQLPMWASQQAHLPAAELAAQREQRLRNHPLGLANSLRGMGTGAQPSLWGGLTTLRIPTLLLVGELDDKFSRINQAIAEQVQDAKLAVIPGAGHNTHLENPAAFARAVRSFLQGV